MPAAASSPPLWRRLHLPIDLRPGEARRALLLTATLTLLMLSYYLLKTTREVLVLTAPGARAELKSYAAGAQAVLLVGVALGFGALASRLTRLRLIVTVTLFFASHLVLFATLLRSLVAARLVLGLVFFVWLGCYSLMILSQFWAYANDLYTEEEGDRIFPLVAAGGAIGALIGAQAAAPLLSLLGPYATLLIAAALLLSSLLTTLWCERTTRGPKIAPASPPPPVVGPSGFRLIRRDRYLLLLAALALTRNWVNTLGEYVLDRRLLDYVHLHAAENGGAAWLTRYIASFKSSYLTWVNLVALGLQLLLVSRLLRWLGPGRLLLLLPLVALSGYGAALALPLVGVILGTKIAENAVDYSAQKTAEEALYLVTPRVAKYKAKAAIDTFLVRLGDVLAALVIFAGTAVAASTETMLVVTLLLVCCWLGVALQLGNVYAARHAAATEEGPGQPPPRSTAPPTPRASDSPSPQSLTWPPPPPTSP